MSTVFVFNKKVKGMPRAVVRADEEFIKCPFFMTETDKSIYCEGCAGGSSNRLKFDRENDKRIYIVKQCYHYPNNCSIAKGAEAKY